MRTIWVVVDEFCTFNSLHHFFYIHFLLIHRVIPHLLNFCITSFFRFLFKHILLPFLTFSSLFLPLPARLPSNVQVLLSSVKNILTFLLSLPSLLLSTRAYQMFVILAVFYHFCYRYKCVLPTFFFIVFWKLKVKFPVCILSAGFVDMKLNFFHSKFHSYL